MSVPGKPTVGKQDYRKYIQSSAWRTKRKKFFDSKLREAQFCYGCDKPRQPGDHVHHKTYKNLGNERLIDLALMCQGCHALAHELDKKPQFQAKGLWYATKEVRKIRLGKKKKGKYPDVQIEPSRPIYSSGKLMHDPSYYKGLSN